MRVQKRFLIGLFGLALLVIVGTGSFLGARSRDDGRPAEASSTTADLAGAAQASASANAPGVDPFVNQYAGEFLCGDMSTLANLAPPIVAPLGPGIYNTEISIHNANSVPVFIQKKAVPMPLAQPEQIGSPTPRLHFTLQADQAFQTDCADIMNTFFPAPAGAVPCNGAPPVLPPQPNDFCKGYLVVEGGKQVTPANPLIVPAPLDMTITITVTDPGVPGTPPNTRSLDFELQPGRVIQYLPTALCPSGWSNTSVPPCP